MNRSLIRQGPGLREILMAALWAGVRGLGLLLSGLRSSSEELKVLRGFARLPSLGFPIQQLGYQLSLLFPLFELRCFQ